MIRYSKLDSSLIRLGGSLFSRRGGNASLVVLIFHRVLPAPDPLLPNEPDAELFSAQMDLVGAHFNVLPLPEAIRRLGDRSLPARALCVTFDDGYANNCTVALPILSTKGIPATVFVATGFLNGGRMFNDTVIESVRAVPQALDLRGLAPGLGLYRLDDVKSRLTAIDAILTKLKHLEPGMRTQCATGIAAHAGLADNMNLMMTDDQVRKLHRAGVQIGAHTVNHPILKTLDVAVVKEEITVSKQRLEEITGSEVTVFAYPNGRPKIDYDGTHVGVARSVGFKGAVSTAWGAADCDGDLFQIPRISPWDVDALRYGLRIAFSYRQRNYATA